MTILAYPGGYREYHTRAFTIGLTHAMLSGGDVLGAIAQQSDVTRVACLKTQLASRTASNVPPLPVRFVGVQAKNSPDHFATGLI